MKEVILVRRDVDPGIMSTPGYTPSTIKAKDAKCGNSVFPYTLRSLGLPSEGNKLRARISARPFKGAKFGKLTEISKGAHYYSHIVLDGQEVYEDFICGPYLYRLLGRENVKVGMKIYFDVQEVK